MFLDPEPKRQKLSMSASPFFSAQVPADSPGDQRWRIKRKPLQEQTQSQINQQHHPGNYPEKPTVRLVTDSPTTSPHHRSSTSASESDFDDIQTAKEIKVQRYDRSPHRLSDLALVQGASAAESGLPGFAASSESSQDQGVSDSYASTNGAPKFGLPPSITLLPKYSDHVVPKTAWHRRSGSSGNYSTSSTLKEADSSIFAYGRRSERLSQGTTLRGTPTPTEHELRERIDAEEAVRQGPAHALQTLQETSPERATIRAVPPSVKSSLTGDHLGSGPSESSLARPQTARSESDAERPPEIPRKSSRRRSSASSLPAPLTIRKASSPAAPREQTSQESLAQPKGIFPEPSSPIFVIYDSDATRPRSRSQPLRFSPSIESIQSRLQYPTVIRPQTGHSLATSNSWASLRPTSSNDTLPPLQIPKKRLRRRPAALSLGSSSAFASSSKMASEEFDTLPYPRNHYSSYLSTIASESDRQSRSTSQHLSHFSLGSGVLTGDDASSIPLSGSWPRRRRESAPVDSVAFDASPVRPRTSSEEGAGDMTLGIFREESAKPQPLFKPRSPSTSGEGRKYDGPLPPIPPIPKSRDSDENFDTVSELQSPALRPKRSGYSLRQRSNSTPSHSNSHSRHLSEISYLDSQRGSQASSLFPTWAKHFYGGTAALISGSKTSLSTNSTPRPQQRQQHERNDSQWTERSITSRLGTGYNELENESPTSSRFLPSIFRPRTRARANTEGQSRSSSKFRRSKRSRPSGDDDDRPDSLAIFANPLPESRDGKALPSGQPKFGELKDSPGSLRPLPRKYSKQKQWDGMEYPRPMTKDRLSDFAIQDPRLAPSKRTSYRLSTWRAPSFVESLDTLVRSKCNRQILLFALGFICPLLWMLAAFLPLPKKPISADDFEKLAGSEEDVQAAMMKHEAGDAERRYREERQWMKARWWRSLNRIMSVIGVLVIAAVIALAVVATR
ncbi:hypothetical protein LTR85_008074 [Meristemomyces frigidus]|nr:hypothetical protein LTR85_008074 [Meristemomyces frigidus]